jgi:hypothetical protein
MNTDVPDQTRTITDPPRDALLMTSRGPGQCPCLVLGGTLSSAPPQPALTQMQTECGSGPHQRMIDECADAEGDVVRSGRPGQDLAAVDVAGEEAERGELLESLDLGALPLVMAGGVPQGGVAPSASEAMPRRTLRAVRPPSSSERRSRGCTGLGSSVRPQWLA